MNCPDFNSVEPLYASGTLWNTLCVPSIQTQYHTGMKDIQSQCPNCDCAALKAWDELDRDEMIVVERLPKSRLFSKEERKKHRFCPRCWFESVETEMSA